jgi:hypothetical protein
MTLDDLLNLIEQDAWKACLVETAAEKAALRDIVTRHIKTPFTGNSDEWDQAYDVGRVSGLADGFDKACEKFQGAVDLITATAEQFRDGAPWVVKQDRCNCHYVIAATNGDYTIGKVPHESDAQAIADVLNAALDAVKEVA